MSDDIRKSIRSVKFDRNVLTRYAGRLGVGKVAVEKDFLISTLFLLLAYDDGFERFVKKAVFRGGTCIRKAYYPDEARFSEDLDFTSLTLDEMDSFLGVLEGLVGKDLGVTTISRAAQTYKDSRGLDIQLDYTSVLGQPNHIMFNLSTSKPLGEAKLKEVEVSPYFDSFKPAILVMGINEILAEKTRALLQRTKPRDVFDFWFLTSKKRMRIDDRLLRHKLMLSYEAAPEDKKASAAWYSISDILRRIEEISELAWKQEMGGLLTRKFPSRKAIASQVSENLKKLGDTRLEPKK